MQEEITSTNTNSAMDSEGVAFGMKGNLFVYVLGSVIASILVVTIMFVLNVHIIPLALIGVSPVILVLIYLKIFKINKPPHYQEDLFEYAINGGSQEKQVKHDEL